MTTPTSTAAGFDVELPISDVSMAVARATIRRVVAFVDDDAESSFLIAVTEVLANAVDELEHIGSTDPIVVRVEFGDDAAVSVIDRGRGITSTLTGRPPGPDRGRGLIVAQAFVPGIEFHFHGQGTTVRLPLAGFGGVR